MSAARETSLTFVRHIRAAPEKVWNAFVDPREILCWWGPDAGPTVSAETDVRVGGGFKVVFETLTGERFENNGKYLELDPPRRIVMSWRLSATPGIESRVTVSIEATQAGSKLTIQHDGFSDDGLAATHEQGWTGAIDKMIAHLENAASSKEERS
jgi:uncharacterized protein YndB with AHSA1/START domain